MILLGAKWRNFLCYRGDHSARFRGTIYGIAARQEDDAERSNWLGKSTLPALIAWVLYGWRDPETTRFDDDVITDGRDGGEPAKDVMGQLELEGLWISRTKVRGKPAKLQVTVDEGDVRGAGVAMGDDAQKIIWERVGLSERDFFWTAYFQQKRIDRFVSAKPADRIEVAAEWFRFGPLQEAEKQLRRTVLAIAERADLHRQRISQLQQEIGRIINDAEPSQQRSTLANARDAAQLEEQLAQQELAGLEEQRSRQAQAVADQRDLTRYRQVVQDGTRMAQELATAGNEAELREQSKALREQREAAAAGERTTYRVFREKEQLAAGEFDGLCPVAQCQCPIVDQINQDRRQNQKLLREARKAYEDAKQQHEKVRLEHEELQGRLRAIDQLSTALQGLRAEGRRLKPTAQRAAEAQQELPPEQELQTAVVAARERLGNAKASLLLAQRAIAQYETVRTAIAELAQQVERADLELAVHREALAIFGRNGAQRRVAEGALQEIETGANQMLQSCGIDLSVRVRWGREGKGLASTCEACGTPFGKSERVKRCDRCGAERGPTVEHRLDLELSDRSGAANDLCGVAFQLSAARWLRADRCAGWSTLLIDEPFGALDAANRRTVATHFATLLSGQYGFRQAFVIAHHGSVIDALPGRVDILRRRDGSAEVTVS